MFLILRLGNSFALELKETFIYCSEGSPSGFNPQLTIDGPSFNASAKPIYNRLLNFTFDKKVFSPSLAESWQVDKKALRYTFKLRRDVHFHKTKYFTPTRKFNADDVLFSFKRMWEDKHPFNKVNGGQYKYFSSMGLKKLIKEIKRVDPFTVEFILNKPDATFLSIFGMSFTSILSQEYASKLEAKNKKEEIDFYPVGTGPFVFKNYQKDSLIRYTAHQKYFQGAPKIKNLIYAITPDGSVRVQKLKNGECHLITLPPLQNIEVLKKHKDLKVVSTPGLNVGYLAMNVQKKTL